MEFIENLTNYYNIDLSDKKNLRGIISTLISLYYIADVQLVILKTYLNNKLREELTDEEVKLYAMYTKENIFGKFKTLRIDRMQFYDRSRIYKDFRMFKELYNLGLFKYSNIDNIPNIIEYMNNFNIEAFANKNHCTRDVKILVELENLGIKDYLEETLRTKKLILSK